ncbi:choice-of-anchor L domain-containing protein [Flavobacterium sp.]|uniref:choice-of-anchor L domain-containing protein n=1 Tax=Flavobacterium sp. TaxID=239 RepID=UPI0025C70FB3|nr:choice-of-anchor L domain-containing protein [Flavobacterium sp.]
MRRITLLLFLLFSLFVNAQLTVNNTTVTPQQLVQNVLLGSGITVTNVKFNGSTANASVSRDQAGLFNGGVSTNLGINSGVILATGKAQVAIGPNGAGSSSNPTANPLEGDPDLALLSGQTIRNVAILEFDFIPQGQNLSFQYVFASEEYPEYSASTYNDAFGFFLSGPGISGPYSGGARNIALIPSSTTAITINNVNNGTINNGPCNNCNYYVNNTTSGQNPFPGPGSSLIQYDGFTTVLTAAATVQCGQTYHIKLAIANVGDNGYDSAVFIQGGSFNVTPVNLGVDLTGGYSLCLGEVTTLNTGLPASVLHQWSFNGVIIPGATGPTLTINQNGANIPGTYTVIAYPFGPACPVSDSIDVDYFPGPTLTTPPPVSLCDNISPPLFNLNSVIPIIMNGQSISDFENYGFYLTQADAMNDVNMIPMSQWSAFPGTNGQIIYFAGENVPDGTGCRAEVHFNLIQVPCPITNPPDLTLCDDASNDGIAVFNFDPQTPIVLGSLTPSNYVVTYHTSQVDANGDVNAITPTNAYSNISNPQTIYVRREEAANPSNFITSSFQLHVVAQPTVTISGSASICLGSSTNLTFTGTPRLLVL